MIYIAIEFFKSKSTNSFVNWILYRKRNLQEVDITNIEDWGHYALKILIKLFKILLDSES